MSDTVAADLLQNPDQIWLGLDSFWREKLVAADGDLVKFTTYAAALAYIAHVRSVVNAVNGNQQFSAPESLVTVPWYPVVVFQDQYTLSNYRAYGDGDLYAVGVTTYGQTGTSKWTVGVDNSIVSAGALVDAVTNSTVVVDRSLFSIGSSTLTTNIDLFSLLTPKTDETSGRQYAVVWLKNAKLDYDLVRNGIGWIVKHSATAGETYDRALRYLYELTTLGVTIGRVEAFLNAASGLPVANEEEVVRRVIDDGGLKHVVTDSTSYQLPSDVTVVPTAGTVLEKYSGMSSVIRVIGGSGVAALSSAVLPGVVLNVPLSTGASVSLGFKNSATTWSYDAGRPSPWRFPVSGETADVEQFWVDCWARQQASGTLLSDVYSLSDPGSYAVNPMLVALSDVADNNTLAILVDYVNCPVSPAAALDRVSQLLPAWPITIIQMSTATVVDALDMSAAPGDPRVGYGTGTTDLYSFSNLVDYQPLVTIS